MKHLYLSVLLIMGFTLQAQVEERIVSMQPNYENQVFFDIETGSTTSIQMGSWDIAFDLTPSGVGIVYNEGGTREGTTIELAAYLAPTNDFTTVFSNPTEEERIYNNEESWSDGGAFNVVADPESAGDIGWGIYDESTQSATGTRVFIIGMRDGSFRKIEFSGYSNGVFTGRHANLDGTDEVNFSVDKANFSGKRLAYYNMTTNEVLDLEPAEWDLKFTRYFQLATQFGQTREYPFTGILHNDNSVDVAEARNVDVSTVDFNDYSDDFSDRIKIIGTDWKALNGFSFVIVEDLAYFIRSKEDDNVYKLIFDEFTGSSFGETAFTTENVGILSATSEVPSSLTSASIFPNPAYEQATLVVDLATSLPNNGEAQLTIYDNTGRQLTEEMVELRSGINQFDLPVGDLSSGHYLVRLNWGTEQFTQSLFIR